MTTIHPSLTLVLDLDESLGTQETKLEIARCYSHIGTPVVHTHACENGEEPRNVARFLVSVGTKKYLFSSDEGANELWEASVEPWIGSMLFKVGNNMAAFNKRMRKIGLPELYFNYFNIELEAGRFVVALRPDPEMRIDRPVAAQVGLARKLLNEGPFEHAVRVVAPSATSWHTQEAQARENWDAEIANNASEEGSAPAEETPAPEPSGPMKHWVGSMPDRDKDPHAYAEWEKADREAKSYENTAVPPTDSDELPPIGNPVEEAEPPRFSFAVDYSLWDVYFDDDSMRTFNAATGSFQD